MSIFNFHWRGKKLFQFNKTQGCSCFGPPPLLTRLLDLLLQAFSICPFLLFQGELGRKKFSESTTLKRGRGNAHWKFQTVSVVGRVVSQLLSTYNKFICTYTKRRWPLESLLQFPTTETAVCKTGEGHNIQDMQMNERANLLRSLCGDKEKYLPCIIFRTDH